VIRPKPEAGGKSAAIRGSSSVFAMASGRATGLSTSALTASYHDSVCACMVVQAVVLCQCGSLPGRNVLCAYLRRTLIRKRKCMVMQVVVFCHCVMYAWPSCLHTRQHKLHPAD
jgi:predicted metal-binding protein